MFRVIFMTEKESFENFEAVWARVTERDGFPAPAVSPEKEPEKKLCILPKTDFSRAVRFIPRL